MLLAAVADVDAPQPGHAVEDLGALGIGQSDALGRGDDTGAALFGEAFVVGEGVHVVADVALAPPGGRVTCRRGSHGLGSLDCSCRSGGMRWPPI